MRRARIRRAPIQGADRFWLAHVRDIDDRETGVPVADVESIISANRVMAAGVRTSPSRGFAAGCPLTPHPPAADLFGSFRILQIQNHRDVSVITFNSRRDIGITAVERE